MTTYTSVADANGDFTVPFSSAYTSGEKITVKAEKDGAEKTIQLFAPSSPSGGGGPISFGGSLIDFPQNITSVTIREITGSIANEAFRGPDYPYIESFQNKAKSLIIDCPVTRIGSFAFSNWALIETITYPQTLVEIGSFSFSGCASLKNLTIPNSVTLIDSDAFNSCTALLNITLGNGVSSIGEMAFAYLTNLISVTLLSTAPPTISSGTFSGIKSTARFYVPAASLAAYKAAPVWKTFASKIYAIA
jgi:hypothetical protein